MQAERDANYQGENVTPAQARGRYGRRGAGWFSMDLAVDPSQPVTLVATYAGDERATRTFDVLVDGAKVASQMVERRSPEKNIGFFDVEYKLPAGFDQGKAEDHRAVPGHGRERASGGLWDQDSEDGERK